MKLVCRGAENGTMLPGGMTVASITATTSNERTFSMEDFFDRVDLFRIDATRRLDDDRRGQMGQFLTPAPVAKFMASMFHELPASIHLLDAGAAVGSLSAAFISEVCNADHRPEKIVVTAYELDPLLIDYLRETYRLCQAACEEAGIHFEANIMNEDFIEAGASMLGGNLFKQVELPKFNCVIMNPPYRKIHSASKERKLLSSIGVETSNLYTGFLSVALKIIEENGQIVAITPRSFCNGLYFNSFRKLLLDTVSLRWIHVFESRNKAFDDDDVLQENVIFHAVKDHSKKQEVVITSNHSPNDGYSTIRRVSRNDLVHPKDPNRFIRLVTNELDHAIVQRMHSFNNTLEDLGIDVSTGRIVDFRAEDFLCEDTCEGSVPLIYPGHFGDGCVEWPKPLKKKPAAILNVEETRADLLVPNEDYVLVKRFSSKEEKKRVVAVLYDPEQFDFPYVGLENHLNYYHRNGSGLPAKMAKGLAVFLNSTLVDSYFRQFSGHTQVNATDLRSLYYPSREQLDYLANIVEDTFPDQDTIDRYVEELIVMPEEINGANPVQARKKIEEALSILQELDFPRAQLNERSALTLLALLDLKPATPWAESSEPLCGITQMMDFFAEHYGRQYAPNTRETVRRQTVHQFLQAALIVINPDKPTRPTNSPHTVYQIEPEALVLLKTFGTGGWAKKLKQYRSKVDSLRAKYKKSREMKRIHVQLGPGDSIELSPGGQNVLVKKIMEDFCTRFTPGAKVIYVGDTSKKWAYFDSDLLAELGVTIEEHGKMPDIVVYYEEKGWLALIEAVTSHGPVDPKRHHELRELFKGSKVGLVFVTAFSTRKTLIKYLDEIAWETEVWVADSPSHLIHFDGKRFLGPYASQ